MTILFLWLVEKWCPFGFQGGDIQKEDAVLKNRLDTECARTRKGKMEMETEKASHGR